MSDPKEIWQHQPAEPISMPIELLQKRFQRFETRRRAGFYALGCLAALATAVSLYVLTRTNRLELRAVCALWMAWAVYMIYQSYTRRGSASPAVELTLTFYRAELVRRQRYFSEAWKWFLLPTLLCAVVTVAAVLYGYGGKRFVMNSLPFLTLLLIWFLMLPRQFRRERRDLQLEIDTLDAFSGPGADGALAGL